MSAIAGMLRFDGAPVDRRDLDRVANALRMYGPDRSGVHVADRIGLVHTLMRMTPEDSRERQPWRGASGAVVSADLRLDNRDEIAAWLGRTGSEIADWPDSRLLLAAWEALGDAVWPRLRGPFAAAIWDPNSRKLRLARDPMGANVVMTYQCERFFGFATMPKGLFAMPDVPRELNEEKIADFLVLDHTNHRTTTYKDIFRLPPGRLAIVSAGGNITESRFWSLADIRPVRMKSDAEYAEGLREHLDRAVRRQMRSAHPVGCFLTGGLDSSAVTALASRVMGERGERLSTYTQVPGAGFAGPAPPARYVDETPFVEAIAASLGNLDLNWIRNDEHDDFEALDRFILAFEGPVRNPTNLGWMMGILQLARSQNRRVLLGGLLGNYTISWRGWSQVFDHARRGRLLTAYRQFNLFYQLSEQSRWMSFRKLFIEPLFSKEAVLRNQIRRKKVGPWHSYSAIRPGFADETRLEARARGGEHDFLYFLRPDERQTGLLAHDYLGDWGAAEKASHGVEVRDPTSDLDVVGYCYGVPPEQYLAEGIDRSLVRRAFWGILPPIVLANRMGGFQSADWHLKMSRQLATLKSDFAAIASSSALVRKAIDVERLQRAMDAWPASGFETQKVAFELQLALSRGLALGRFINRFEGGNLPPREIGPDER